MNITNERLREMIDLLEAMRPKTKAPSDGLGLYLGDGMPRPWLASDRLRSEELLGALQELLELRSDGEPDEFDK